jgi:hypothetical protein
VEKFRVFLQDPVAVTDYVNEPVWVVIDTIGKTSIATESVSFDADFQVRSAVSISFNSIWCY